MAKSKQKTTDDYRSLDDQGLTNRIEDEKLQMKRTHFSHAVNPIENPMSIRGMRRSIARLKTEQRKRALGSN